MQYAARNLRPVGCGLWAVGCGLWDGSGHLQLPEHERNLMPQQRRGGVVGQRLPKLKKTP